GACYRSLTLQSAQHAGVGCEMDTNHVRFTLAPRRSGRSLTGMVAGGSTWRAGPPAFPWAVTWSQAWPRSVHPVRWTTPRSLSKEKANQHYRAKCGLRRDYSQSRRPTDDRKRQLIAAGTSDRTPRTRERLRRSLSAAPRTGS